MSEQAEIVTEEKDLNFKLKDLPKRFVSLVGKLISIKGFFFGISILLAKLEIVGEEVVILAGLVLIGVRQIDKVIDKLVKK